MPVVTAVSVWPTFALPVIVGAPAAGVLVPAAGTLRHRVRLVTEDQSRPAESQ